MPVTVLNGLKGTSLARVALAVRKHQPAPIHIDDEIQPAHMTPVHDIRTR